MFIDVNLLMMYHITHPLIQLLYSLRYTIFDTCFASYTFIILFLGKGTPDIDNFHICVYKRKLCKLKCFNVKCLWLHSSILIQTAMLLKLNILSHLRNVSFSSYGVLKIEYLNSSTAALGKNERNSMSV